MTMQANKARLGEVEAAARAMCVEGGFDPAEIMPNDGPRWRYYAPGAVAAISAADRVRSLRSTEGKEGEDHGSDAAAIEIADAVIAWMVRYDLLDADQEYRDDDIIEVLNDLRPDEDYRQLTTRAEAAEAHAAKLREALEFYADPRRYQGPNQRPFEGDKFSIGPYLQDVTKDDGNIARAALTRSPE